MKKAFIFAIVLFLSYLFFSRPDVYYHDVNIHNETGHDLIIYDSPFAVGGEPVKTIYLGQFKEGEPNDYSGFSGEVSYGIFDKPDKAMLVWQIAKKECKKRAFNKRKDCSYVAQKTQPVHRFVLDLKEMRSSEIGRKSGNYCGIFCGHNVLVTSITIHPSGNEPQVSLVLRRATRGGAVL